MACCCLLGGLNIFLTRFSGSVWCLFDVHIVGNLPYAYVTLINVGHFGFFLWLSQKATSSSYAGSRPRYCWNSPNILACLKWCYLVKTLSRLWCYQETRFSFRSSVDWILLFLILLYAGYMLGGGAGLCIIYPKPFSPVSVSVVLYWHPLLLFWEDRGSELMHLIP